MATIAEALEGIQQSIKDQKKYKTKPTEKEVEAAFDVLRADYYSDVLRLAETVLEELDERDDADPVDVLHEVLDGTARVIYTFQAKVGLLCSDNEDAMEEETGETGDVSQRMFYALMQDVQERLDAEGFDLNDPDSWYEEDED